jgi:hypothetical protein
MIKGSHPKVRFDSTYATSGRVLHTTREVMQKFQEGYAAPGAL